MKNLDNINEHIKILEKQKNDILNKTKTFSKIIIKAISENKKILVAGNGGSAADAQHLSTEMTVKMKFKRKALPFMSLTTDTSALTAIGNDFDFSKIFSRQIEALGNEKDIFFAITTSGNSKNILNALKLAKKKRMKCIGLLGNQGGKSLKLCDDYFVVDSKNPSRIQEIHILFYQMMCEYIELFFKDKIV